jgi:biopolymer transport protein ExbD
VIFLLLLFFMLTSTFSRFSEVELSAAAGAAGASAKSPPIFLRISPESVSLNGREMSFEGLEAALSHDDAAPRVVLVSLAEGVTAQRLTDLLGALRKVPKIAPTVLGRA